MTANSLHIVHPNSVYALDRRTTICALEALNAITSAHSQTHRDGKRSKTEPRIQRYDNPQPYRDVVGSVPSLEYREHR
jgi:hypothetical protein